MIVRDEGATFLLITQPDHARVAEQIASGIRSECALTGSSRDVVLLATREHDNGWVEVDANPTVDPATGRPSDFMTGPANVKHELWLRGIARVARMDPHAGALVAQHAITVYGYRRSDAAWQPFFDSIVAMRDALLQQLGMSDPASREAFQNEYRCVQIADALSLYFCHGGSDVTTLNYQCRLDGATLRVFPDPFAGAAIPLRVLGRRIPARRYADDADLREAMRTAAPHVVEGQAAGGLMA
jgi:hypothetical protein